MSTFLKKIFLIDNEDLVIKSDYSKSLSSLHWIIFNICYDTQCMWKIQEMLQILLC